MGEPLAAPLGTGLAVKGQGWAALAVGLCCSWGETMTGMGKPSGSLHGAVTLLATTLEGRRVTRVPGAGAVLDMPVRWASLGHHWMDSSRFGPCTHKQQHARSQRADVNTLCCLRCGNVTMSAGKQVTTLMGMHCTQDACRAHCKPLLHLQQAYFSPGIPQAGGA